MWRVIFLFVAALVVANTTGLIPEGDDTECADRGEGKQCPPTCPTCTCAWHAVKSAPAPVVELTPIELTGRVVELPPPSGSDGRRAAAPVIRPPIV